MLYFQAFLDVLIVWGISLVFFALLFSSVICDRLIQYFDKKNRK